MGKRMKSLAFLVVLWSFFVVAFTSCRVSRVSTQSTSPGISMETQTITVNSEPTGAKVVANGSVVCTSTPCTIKVPNQGGKIEFVFIKDGYVTGQEVVKPTASIVKRHMIWTYPDVFHVFDKQTYANDPTIRAGEGTNMVTRDQPGATALERSIIHWNFDSEPRGGRIFWRVISSIPDQVKNTNETYLTSTPYEETRAFNILGLTYENSRDITIEIKVTKTGYMDQVKRYNVRQAIDQQEISGFFELVKDDNYKQ